MMNAPFFFTFLLNNQCVTCHFTLKNFHCFYNNMIVLIDTFTKK